MEGFLHDPLFLTGSDSEDLAFPVLEDRESLFSDDLVDFFGPDGASNNTTNAAVPGVGVGVGVDLSDQTGSEWYGTDGFIQSDGNCDDGQLLELPAQVMGNGGSRVSPFDDFFTSNGAWRPPKPCAHCKQMRMQCFFLQTTSVNPNPLTSCSSCVALFRDCSLAERGKRQPSEFETPQPVIGHLHGVNEEDGNPVILNGTQPAATDSGRVVNSHNKRASSRSVRRTRILRNWFAAHHDDPYPSEDEKTSLAQQSGLTKTQVANWFSNARRRQRLTARALNNQNFFFQGSPMPRSSFSNMTPLERWRSSPPDEEPVSSAAIEKALDEFFGGVDNTEPWDSSFTSHCASSTSGDSGIYAHSHHVSSNSASSCYSQSSNDFHALFSLPTTSFEENSGRVDLPSSLSTPAPASLAIYQCTFCHKGFKKRSDWVRHERSVHLRSLDSWICAIPLPATQPYLTWRLGQDGPECILCGHASPTEEHFQSHEFSSCAERTIEERTFNRKDHLWQHLYKFHGCRKWDGWDPDLTLLRYKRDELKSRCGFCQADLDSWDQRVDHVASHFRAGLSMMQWTGGSGIDGV